VDTSQRTLKIQFGMNLPWFKKVLTINANLVAFRDFDIVTLCLPITSDHEPTGNDFFYS